METIELNKALKIYLYTSAECQHNKLVRTSTTQQALHIFLNKLYIGYIVKKNIGSLTLYQLVINGRLLINSTEKECRKILLNYLTDENLGI